MGCLEGCYWREYSQSGNDMLAYVDLAKTALERHPPLLDFLKSWIDDKSLKVLKPEEWFVEAMESLVEPLMLMEYGYLNMHQNCNHIFGHPPPPL